jgi:hypothetical protein
MFRKIALFSFFLVLLAGTISVYFCVQLRPEDLPRYQKLVQESAELRSKKALEAHPARQLRKDVQKDIWTLSGAERTHLRLKSEGSELVIRQRKDKLEATEYLQNLTCSMQEEVNSAENRQQVRYLTALQGTYFFPSHRFLAEQVRLCFYQIGGIDLPQEMPQTPPFLRGAAREVSFSAAGKTGTFKAHHLQAELSSEAGLP